MTGQRHLLDLVDDTRLRDAIAKVIDLYEEHVQPVRHLFKKGQCTLKAGKLVYTNVRKTTWFL